MIDTGKSLRLAMAQADMQGIELATLLNTSQQQVAIWRRNKSATFTTVKKLADVFGMKITEFLILGEQ